MPREDFLDGFCDDIAGTVGAFTGAIYGGGTLAVTGNTAAAVIVDNVISATVEDGWHDVCDLPANLNDAFSNSSDSSPSSGASDGGAISD